MDEIFNKSFNELLQLEGGYVNDPADSGGKTRYGITEAVARKHGYEGDMRKLPLELAKSIYYEDYWVAIGLHKMDAHGLTYELFDSAVNVGTTKAVTWLQECLNVLNNNEHNWDDVVVDGKVGNQTIKVVNNVVRVKKWEKRLVKLLNCVQGAYYKEISTKYPKNKRFMAGWLYHRVKIK